MYKKYNQSLAESISMVIKDETGGFGESKINEDIAESIKEDSLDSFDEYIGSKFGTSIMKSQGISKSGIDASKSKVTEIIDYDSFGDQISEKIGLTQTISDYQDDITDEVDRQTDENEIIDEIDHNDKYGSEFHSLEDSHAKEIIKKPKKFIKKKKRKTRPGRKISDKELETKPDFDIHTLERRFCQL
mmetsp:Transcript_5631/g.4840  ORF Transcript_5631/g.4840 Transcript_5631/m.4840 type:complete len:188 (-) Transcript_5631:1383-1946(-)